MNPRNKIKMGMPIIKIPQAKNKVKPYNGAFKMYWANKTHVGSPNHDLMGQEGPKDTQEPTHIPSPISLPISPHLNPLNTWRNKRKQREPRGRRENFVGLGEGRKRSFKTQDFKVQIDPKRVPTKSQSRGGKKLLFFISFLHIL